MKKNVQFLIGSFLLLLIMNSPVAAGGYYLGIQGGMGFPPESKGTDSQGRVNFSYDSGYDGSVTLGYDLGNDHPNLGNGRVELEFNKASNDINEVQFVENNVGIAGSADRTSIMLNTIGEYVTESGMIIYALLGIGWAEITLDNITILNEPFIDDSNSQFAYQAGFGLAWKLSGHWAVDVGYRYYGTTDLEFTKQDGTGLDFEYASHRVLAGLRLNF
jgi:opacity protein-like surface antigen